MTITYIRDMYPIDKMEGEEDIGWCSCYQADDYSENYMVITVGAVQSIRTNGEDDQTCDVDRLAEIVNPGYDRELYDAKEAAKDAMHKCGCRNCPWVSVCGAMNDDSIGEIYKVVNDDGDAIYYVENDDGEIETVSADDMYYPLNDNTDPLEWEIERAKSFAERHQEELNR